MKALQDIQTDATYLHALCQAAAELFEACDTKSNAASNGLHALLSVLVERADRLADELDRTKNAARSQP